MYKSPPPTDMDPDMEHVHVVFGEHVPDKGFRPRRTNNRIASLQTLHLTDMYTGMRPGIM